MIMEDRITMEVALNIYKTLANILHVTSNDNIEYVLKQFKKDGITLNELYTIIKNSFGEDMIINYFKVMESRQQVEQMLLNLLKN